MESGPEVVDRRGEALADLAEADARRSMAILVSDNALAEARADLAEAIASCRHEGFSLRQVARELGWHHETVRELLARVNRTE
jgi:DNA-directed RNA polymerase specialized sigma24 family protein